MVLLLELQRATHATLHHLTAHLADLGLSPSELNALANLGARADAVATVSELGAAIGGRPTTLTGILDRLEQRGLLAREPHPRDRRTVVVRPTAEGARVAARILDAMAQLERRLTPEAVEAVSAALRELSR
ncbi:MarR family winged helix-turn-helix transcriptional regulator [Dactylosporangium sp. CA-139066]|uniref:MarR family winged helix-turn-helix transcriptional regulator n=1 Tax=Dactylosporangium sp. CA-139066 TaxID=3239930 RepID=UPI003D8C7EF3